MSTGGKVAVGIGVAALAGGAIYWAYRNRQNMLAAQGVVTPVPVGITSIYSVAGSMASAAGVPLPSAAMVGGVPLQVYKGGASAQPLGGSAASASFAAAAAAAAGAMVPPVSGPAVETRSGRGHF